MSENPGNNEISSNKGSRSIEVYFPILFYKYFGTLITGRLMEDGRLIGEQSLERSLQPQAPRYRPRTISGPPYQAPPHSKPSHIKPPISGPLPYQAPNFRLPFPYQSPHPRPTILNPDDQYEAPR